MATGNTNVTIVVVDPIRDPPRPFSRGVAMRSTSVSSSGPGSRCRRFTNSPAAVSALAAAITAAVAVAVGAIAPPVASAQEELSYAEFRAISRTAERLLHTTMFEPLEGQNGMYFALGDRFNRVNVYRITGDTSERVWRSQSLSGNVDELLVIDRDGDELDDSLVARTSAGRIYVWSLDDYRLQFESLAGDYTLITCFTAANMDDDPQTELVINADRLIYYLDCSTFNRDFTSLNEAEATEIRCGDVDGDDRVEVVLNTGAVLDGLSGNVEWAEEAFGQRLELLDFDGDGILEVLAETDGGVLRVFEIDNRVELRFQ
jgi:hypothetical protein